jgi:hypothetical protein
MRGRPSKSGCGANCGWGTCKLAICAGSSCSKHSSPDFGRSLFLSCQISRSNCPLRTRCVSSMLRIVVVVEVKLFRPTWCQALTSRGDGLALLDCSDILTSGASSSQEAFSALQSSRMARWEGCVTVQRNSLGWPALGTHSLAKERFCRGDVAPRTEPEADVLPDSSTAQ